MTDLHSHHNTSNVTNVAKDPTHDSKLTNFAQKKAYSIDTPFVDHIKALLTKFQINPKTGNKFYKLIETNDLSLLASYEYRICFNLKQKPMYLLLTTYGGSKYCIYFDSDLVDFFSVKHRFDAELFNDTLFEGELLKIGPQNYIFLLSDILLQAGQPVHSSLVEKLEQLRQIVANRYVTDPGLDPCQILVKDYVEYKHLDSFAREYKNQVPYSSLICGILFRPIHKSNKQLVVVLNRRNFHTLSFPAGIDKAQLSGSTTGHTSLTNSHREPASSTTANPHQRTQYQPRLPPHLKSHQQSQTQHNLHQPPAHHQGGLLPTPAQAPLGRKMSSVSSGAGGLLAPPAEVGSSEQTNLTSPAQLPPQPDDNIPTVAVVATDKLKLSGDRDRIDHKKHPVVIFEIRKTDLPDIYQLWLYDTTGKLFKYGIASVPTRQLSETVKNWFVGGEDKLTVSCRYVKTFGKWSPVDKLAVGTPISNINDLF